MPIEAPRVFVIFALDPTGVEHDHPKNNHAADDGKDKYRNRHTRHTTAVQNITLVTSMTQQLIMGILK